MPQLCGMFFGHLHNLVGVAIADIVCFLDGIEKRVGNVPGGAVGDDEAKWQGGLVEVCEESDGEVAELDVLEVEAGGGEVEVGGQAGEEESEVAEAGDGGDEWRRRGGGGR